MSALDRVRADVVAAGVPLGRLPGAHRQDVGAAERERVAPALVDSLDRALERIARRGPTQKLHARGPIGLAELTADTCLVTGRGHVR